MKTHSNRGNPAAVKERQNPHHDNAWLSGCGFAHFSSSRSHHAFSRFSCNIRASRANFTAPVRCGERLRTRNRSRPFLRTANGRGQTNTATAGLCFSPPPPFPPFSPFPPFQPTAPPVFQRTANGIRRGQSGLSSAAVMPGKRFSRHSRASSIRRRSRAAAVSQ